MTCTWIFVAGSASGGTPTEKGRKVPWSVTGRVLIFILSWLLNLRGLDSNPGPCGPPSRPLCCCLVAAESMGHGGAARFIWDPKVKGVPFWVPSVPSSSLLLWKKSNLVCTKANPKASLRNFCLILELSPLGPPRSVLQLLLDPQVTRSWEMLPMIPFPA